MLHDNLLEGLAELLDITIGGARVSTNTSSLRGGRRHALAVGAALHAFRLALAERGLGSCLLHASVARWPLDAVRRALAVPDPPRPRRHRRGLCYLHHYRHDPTTGEDEGDDNHDHDRDDDGDEDDGGCDLDHRCAANMQILCALAVGYEDADFLVGSIAPAARGATVERSMVWVRD